MCGIFGICYGPDGPEAEDWSPSDFLQIMFPAIVHRGPHAWGYMYHSTGSEQIDYFKSPGRCDNQQAALQMVAPEAGLDWIVGHVRYATNGKPEFNQNNHPILHGDIIGVHNGVLKDWQRIIKDTGRQDPSSEVDSEAIFAAVNKWGMRGGLSRIQGDMVTVFASLKSPATLRIARSHGRPLVYATTKAGSLIFASESCVIDATGIDTTTHAKFEGRYRMLTVRSGRITERVQYKAEAPRQFEGTRGITDYMSGGGHGGGHRLVSPQRESTPREAGPLMINKVDRYGGTYRGANMWELPDGRMVNAEQYVEWAVQKRIDILRAQVKAQKEAQATPASKSAESKPPQPAAAAVPATERKVTPEDVRVRLEQARAVVENNGNQ